MTIIQIADLMRKKARNQFLKPVPFWYVVATGVIVLTLRRYGLL